MPNAVDITGLRFGRLIALEYAGYLRSGPQPKRAYKFRCDCGAEVVRTVMDVRRMDTMSCGCLKRDVLAKKPARNRLTSGESSFRSLYAMYASRAGKLGVAFDLDQDEFRALTQCCCAYCDAPPVQVRRANRSSHGTFLYNGIDRVATMPSAIQVPTSCRRAACAIEPRIIRE